MCGSLSVKHLMTVFASVCLAMSAWCDGGNDAWENATVLSGGTGSAIGNNTSATTEANETGDTKNHSLWWKWQAPDDAKKAAFHTYGSDFDTVIGVYTGTAVTSLTKVTNINDDHNRWGGVTSPGNEYASLVSFDVTPGTTYYICVGGKDETACGNVKLEWCSGSDFTLVTCDDGKTLLGFIGECPKTFPISENITKIEQSAFDRDCDASVINLESVVIPQSVTNIGLYAFCKCSNLSNVTYKGDAKSIAMNEYWVFYDTPFRASANSKDDDVPGDTPETPEERTITLDLGGGTGAESLKVAYGSKVGNITKPTRANYKFVGWFTSPTGGTRVSDDTVITSDMNLYARWEEIDVHGGDEEFEVFYLYENAVGVVPATAATVYDGYLYEGNDCVGTIQVKVGKPNRRTNLATAKATVVGKDGKKKNIKAAEKGKVLIAADGPTSITLVGGEACEVTLGTYGMKGKYGNYEIDGARNMFSSRAAEDKAVAASILENWKGAVNVAWEGYQGWNGVSVSIANKGKAKVTVTLADGTKASANSQLIVGERWCCVPALVTKKMNMAFILWVPRNGQDSGTLGVIGIEESAVGKPGSLKSNAAFRIDADAFTTMWGKNAMPYLPDGVPVGGGTRWTLPKAGKVAYVRGTTEVDAAKLLDNPSALKLTYKAKDGTFKGSFKAYAVENGKPKATTVNVAGVLVDGIGYGTATIKKVGSVPIKVE